MMNENGGRDKGASGNGRHPDAPDIVLYKPDEKNTSIFDVALALVRHLRLIGIAALVGAALGVIAALMPEETNYTATASVIREGESGSRVSSPMMSLNRLGLNLGGGGSGMTVAVYPEVLESREVRYAVVRDTFYIEESGGWIQLSDYFDRPPSWWDEFSASVKAYTIGLPSTLLQDNQSAGSTQVAETVPPTLKSSRYDVLNATSNEKRAMNKVRNWISTSIQQGTGLMEVSATAPEARLSVDLVQSFLKHFQVRVREIQTEKARQDVEFVHDRFEQAAAELEAAEEELAAFLDRNQSLQSARLITERERLQRKVDFKASLYSELQAQVTQAELNLQSSNPVVTVLEGPAMPSSPSGASPSFIVFVSALFGVLIGVVLALGKSYLENNKTAETEERDKITQIEHILANTKIAQFVRRHFGTSRKGSVEETS